MMKMLRATRVEPPFGAQMAFERVVQPLGWIGLGALTAGAVAWALLRSGRWPSNGEEPDGQEPDVLLDVSELEVDKINLEVERLRAHVSILVELANLLTACCDEVDPYSILESHGCLLRRPQKENRRSR